MKYGLIGEHLPHSFSKEIHGRLAGYDYQLKELPPQQVKPFLEKKEFLGINVTIPYKQEVIPALCAMSEKAKKIGAVNTIVNRSGLLYGYNTDFGGMEALFAHAGVNPAGQKVLILGTGGTSKTALAVATDLGAKEVYRVSRSGRDGAITYEEAYQSHGDAGILINTTPCGMFPKGEDMPADISCFPCLTGVIDAVYNPLRTRLVLEARKRGIPAEGGLYMLTMQAVLACEIFTGQKILPETAEKAYRDVLNEKENIVLTGMPGSGKTTIGRLLAKSLDRQLIDTDAEIVKQERMKIPEIFAARGEAAFRALERDVIARVSQQTGVIISTGGGAILREDNVTALRQNGRVLFLDRPLESLLPTPGRPLASSREAITQRYNERYSRYLATCDGRIPVYGTPETTAENVKKEFYQ